MRTSDMPPLRRRTLNESPSEKEGKCKTYGDMAKTYASPQ